MRFNRLILIVATAAAVTGATTASATKLYKWVDRQGNVSYQDSPPPSNYGKVEERTFKGGSSAADDPALAAAVAKSPVVLYATAKCAPCDMVRNYLNTRKVPFTEKNAAGDVAVQEELRKAAGSLTVPTVAVGSKVITEYSQAWLDSELDQAGYPKKPGSETKKPEGEETQ